MLLQVGPQATENIYSQWQAWCSFLAFRYVFGQPLSFFTGGLEIEIFASIFKWVTENSLVALDVFLSPISDFQAYESVVCALAGQIVSCIDSLRDSAFYFSIWIHSDCTCDLFGGVPAPSLGTSVFLSLHTKHTYVYLWCKESNLNWEVKTATQRERQSSISGVWSSGV